MQNKQAKYIELGELLLQQILRGHYPLSALLPTEKELCAQHGISRHTAREGLRYIERIGLVERRQGAGTRVIRTNLPEQINQFTQSVQELLEFGQQTRFSIDVCQLLITDKDEMSRLKFSHPREYIYLAGVRSEVHDKKPICYSSIQQFRYHTDLYAKDLDKKTALKQMMHLLSSSNIGRVEQEFTACLLTSDMAQKLNDQAHSAGMRVVRKYFSKQGELVLLAESIYPAHRYRYINVLTPASKKL
ncbi:GntR family transcriptional regulator [Alkalimonas sp. MEB108]|uniref:GntR family transcriptional regulator n=1 Tax=Alkalimonas cellulosilytica TaxID=3058395 RepID=A0ABU7J8R5_9GAMM|nr:GntR family transcriptional regulator [Alkalimonas sp. MEB108]MEE2002938.1 GntR family transcriptional regulator [Alkalimonas sp. MEB108]